MHILILFYTYHYYCTERIHTKIENYLEIYSLNFADLSGVCEMIMSLCSYWHI